MKAVLVSFVFALSSACAFTPPQINVTVITYPSENAHIKAEEGSTEIYNTITTGEDKIENAVPSVAFENNPPTVPIQEDSGLVFDPPIKEEKKGEK